ncbi:MAG: hypothetical protein WD010_02080 [Nitriliruptor sp.]|uniref:hypothetical protein n=1 Tax=Nitriliruptor sp. TaxID=2448056 RepID=UPI0034A07243
MEVVQHADVASAGRARDALANADWAGAFRLLSTVEAERELDTAELELLAYAAYGAGELEASLTAWEQLHAAHVASGDHLGAAGAAATLAMYLMMDTGLMAPVRGWLTRAERLLEGQEEHRVHALVAMVRTYERIMCGDLVAARHWSSRTVEVGERHDAEGPVAIGRIATARLLIFDGHVDQGLELLDDAAVALVSSSLDPLTIGMVYCELICAMQGLAQYDRAEEWTEAMDRWRRDDAFGGINGRCRVHRAEMLRLRGACDDAEEEALHACAELRPWMRREYGWPLTELGTIRLRRGDLAGAEEAFLGAHEHGWDPQPGLALLRLAQGDVAGARALIREALERPADLPSKERPPRSELCRAPLLEAEVEIAVAAGDIPAARRAATELSSVAQLFRSRALDASASLARGRVALAGGDNRAAMAACERAVTAWCEVGAPYETAAARMVLAEAAHAEGDGARAALESHAAAATLHRIGAWRRSDPEASSRPTAGATTVDELATGSARSETVFRLDGDTRTVTFAGHEVLLRDLKGMRYLARLLAQPGREFHVLDVVGAEAGASTATAIDADGLFVVASDGLGPVLDDRARESYRRRLAEVDEDIDEASRRGDSERAALAAADRDYLITELSRAYGLGGRTRVSGATSERARASVTRSLRYALARIAEHHPQLAEHLDRTVRTGTYCSYVPDPRVPIRWQV